MGKPARIYCDQCGRETTMSVAANRHDEIATLRAQLAEAEAEKTELLRRAQSAEDTAKRLTEALQALATGDWLSLCRKLAASRERERVLRDGLVHIAKGRIDHGSSEKARARQALAAAPEPEETNDATKD